MPRWGDEWRDETWARAAEPLDVLIIGGGITGAGLLVESARRGLKALLLEGDDFAAGTSSRSGKLVHGGMRYLKQGRVGLTRSLLLERDRLLVARPGLVDPLEFVIPTYVHARMDRVAYGVAVRAYDLLRGHRKSWRRYGPDQVIQRVPGLRSGGLDGGFGFGDAVTDDARLVLRTLRDAAALGGHALNYTHAGSLVREGGRVVGAELHDRVADRSVVARARVVFNATGAGADRVRGWVGRRPRLRPIRGTHLMLPHRVLPLRQAVSFRHPVDGRYTYLLPWEGATVVGTTDRDHPRDGVDGSRATAAEVEYLLHALHHWLPGAGVTEGDVMGTVAGLRPVVDTGRADPYQEKRGSVLWKEEGLVTVISGKLTGFLPIVTRALDTVADRRVAPASATGVPAELDGLAAPLRTRLVGRYGDDAPALVDAARDGELEPVDGTSVPWAELRWALRAEGVHHLDDLLLRRARIGLLLPRGGETHFPRIAALCQEELGWSRDRWNAEAERYRRIWREEHGIPGDHAAPVPARPTVGAAD